MKDLVSPAEALPVEFGSTQNWGCFLVGGLVVVGAGGIWVVMSISDGSMSANTVSAGFLCLVGVVPLLLGLRGLLFARTRKWTITQDAVSFEQSGLLEAESWTEPLNNYEGIVATVEDPEEHDIDTGPKMQCALTLTLRHPTLEDRNVRLFETFAEYEPGQDPPAEVRRELEGAHKRYAELLDLPALRESGEEGPVELPGGAAPDA